jgi:signal transduction histidine kinase
LKQQKRYELNFRPQIWIDIDPTVQAVSIEDNGPGVDPKRREAIFQPFVTSKPPGQGRGLGLYISRELAHYHGWQLLLDPQVGRKRPRRLSRFVLDMGGKQ